MQYKYLGLLATAILILGLAFVAYKWPHGRHKTFSQHVATQRIAVIYYCLLFLVVLPLLVAFFAGWFVPHFGANQWLTIFVILAAIFQSACTFVPETGGRKTVWHQALAGLSAICLVPAMAVLLLCPALSLAGQVAAVFALATMAGCIYLVSKAKGSPRNFLLIQCAYFAAFLLPAMLISYVPGFAIGAL
jgi:hypothetical protein